MLTNERRALLTSRLTQTVKDKWYPALEWAVKQGAYSRKHLTILVAKYLNKPVSEDMVALVLYVWRREYIGRFITYAGPGYGQGYRLVSSDETDETNIGVHIGGIDYILDRLDTMTDGVEREANLLVASSGVSEVQKLHLIEVPPLVNAAGILIRRAKNAK
jgi:hypothetical protein